MFKKLQFRLSVKFILLWNILFCLGLSAYTVLFNLYLKEVVSITDIGTVVGISYLVYGGFSLLSGFLSDRFGPKKVLHIGVLVLFLGIVGSIFTQSIVSLYMWAVVTGVGLSLTNVMFVPLLTEYSTSAERTKLFSIAFGTGNLFMFFGTMGAGFIADFLSSHYRIGAVASFRGVIFSAALVIVLSSLPLLLIKGEKRTPIAKTGALGNRLNKRVVSYGVVKLLEGIGIGLSVPFLNLFLSGRFDLTAGKISLILSSATLFTVAMIFSNPFISKRLGEAQSLVVYQLIGLPCLLLLGWMEHIWITALCLLGFRAFFYAMMPIQSKLLMEKTPENIRGFTNSVGSMNLMLGTGAAGLVSMRIVNHLGEYWGFLTLFTLSALCISVSVMIFYFQFKSSSVVTRTKMEQVS
ncbi:MFS transporter [Pseudoneobacillus sp. C159]